MVAPNRSEVDSRRRRVRVVAPLAAQSVAAAIAATVIGLLLAPSSALAAGCNNEWKEAKDGSWFVASNWSKKAVPNSSQEVCITKSGSYTVTLEPTGLSEISVKALTIGGAEGAQKLAVASSSASGNLRLITTKGIGIEPHGAVSMNNVSSGNNTTLSGSITNAGTITAEPGAGGGRYIEGNVTNNGTVSIADLTTLTIPSGSAITNSSSGTITSAGVGRVLTTSGGTFNEAGGSTGGTGTEPVVIEGGALVYSGSSGKSQIAARGQQSTLSGNLSSEQSLSIEGDCSGAQYGKLTAAASFTNAGTITLKSHNQGCGYSSTLAVSSGTLTNTGTIATEPDIYGDQRYLEGNVTNKKTLALNAPGSYNANGTTLTNEGTVQLANGVSSAVQSGATITNGTGGIISSTGTGAFHVLSGGTFNEAGGSTGGTGTEPVVIEGGALVYSGSSGKSQIAARGQQSTLSGNLSSEQSLSIEGDCVTGGYAKLTAAASFTNAGTITLTSHDQGCGYWSDLAVSSGTLTNTGTIATEPDIYGDQRYLEGNVTNNGTVSIADPTTLTIPSGSAITNSSSGTITSAGVGRVLTTSGGTFNEAGGSTGGTGTEPVVIEGGALVYSGSSGKSQIAARGQQSTLSGNLSSEQSLSIEGDCVTGGYAKLTAAASFTNAGTITLTSHDQGCGYWSGLAVSSGTLTNTGTIATEPDIYGDQRYIEGNVTNNGTVNELSGASLMASNGITLNGTGGTFTSTGTGAFHVLSGGTFNEAGGSTGGTGTEPVVIEGGALVYSGSSGKSQIAARGQQSTLSGNLSSEQSLSIEGDCSGAQYGEADRRSELHQRRHDHADEPRPGLRLLERSSRQLGNAHEHGHDRDRT